MSSTFGSVRRLKVLYEELAVVTQPKCGECTPPFSCCRPIHCRTTRQWAHEFWGVLLQETGHPELPLMGPKGCTAPPHLRPHCSSMVCDCHLDNPEFLSQLKDLRERISEEELRVEEKFETL